MWGLVWGKVFMWDKLTRVLDVVFSFFGNIRDLIYWIACSSTLLNLHWWLTICEVLAEKKFLCGTNRRQFQTLFFSNFENITDLIFYWRACSSTLLNLHCRLTICEVSSEEKFLRRTNWREFQTSFFPLFLTIEILLNIQTIKIWKTRTTSPSAWQVFLYDLIPDSISQIWSQIPDPVVVSSSLFLSLATPPSLLSHNNGLWLPSSNTSTNTKSLVK